MAGYKLSYSKSDDGLGLFKKDDCAHLHELKGTRVYKCIGKVVPESKCMICTVMQPG